MAVDLAWEYAARRFDPPPVSPYLGNPVGWMTEKLGAHLWSKQREIADSVVANKRTAVKSCHNAGKSWIAAQIAGYWIDVHPPGEAFIVSTAPSYPQVHAILWEEIRKTAKNPSGDPLPGRVLQSDEWKLDDGTLVGWGRKPADTDQHGFQGIHRKYVLVILDEACGIPEQLWTAVEAITTTDTCRILAIGNPDDPNTEFGNVCKPGSGWNVIRISGLDTPNFTGEQVPAAVADLMLSPEWVEDKRRRWGENSPRFTAKCLGEFPEIGDDTLISPRWIEAAQQRKLEPGPHTILGVDVARFGCFDAETEILTDQGWKFFADVKGDEAVLSLDGDVSKWMPITAVHAYPFDGYLNEYTNRTTSFAITDNHNLLARSPRSSEWKIRRYDALPRISYLRRASTWAGEERESITFREQTQMPHGGYRLRDWTLDWGDFCELVGWFVAEGCVYREKRDGGRLRICIAQRGARGRAQLETLLDRMGFPWSYGGNNYQIYCKSFAEWLEANCGIGASNKRIPREIRDSSTASIERFLDGYREGDGSWNSNGGATYSTTSRQLVDHLQEILAKVGRCGMARLRSVAGSTTEILGRTVVRKHDVWLVGEYKRATDIFLDKNKITKMRYVGNVYCVSTPLRTILVRRRGFVMWSGNSDETILALARGPVVRIVGEHAKQRTTETTGHVIVAKREHGVDEIRVDGVGVGSGVVDQLLEAGHDVVDMQSGAAALDSEHYANARAEWWWGLRQRFEDGDIDIDPDDDELAAQLGTVKYKFTARGQVLIESKDDMKKRGVPSPDRADAVMLAKAHVPPPDELVEDEGIDQDLEAFEISPY
ncbi:LAGLIDADG family homing endonuclease [Actinomadura bangladeshensis]|uniref:DOD-type homing endonuclease domain-containing protein n=1 Tax=Actinomadura bangladeshensis TaxID=453573 RepID=A0A6L9Q829_9ACTN|nr:LAGLIDADG family homing endonuclease [Actinomadura bangladeshensis]NEA21609.1 hypothetical protein [Actinomadura bangladeshensis]NEA22569.1 hypothetical protein [Actinomadura bangladeshensis]